MSSSSSTTTSSNNDDNDVLFSNEGMARLIQLNRPKKLNSLNTSMVNKITPRLLEYGKSGVSNVIIMTSTSPKGLCAGGDVAECARQILEGNSGYASDFFQQEYNLNYLTSTYAKPYIAYMNGITMGGGVGLSVHSPFRIATETTKLAMPEMDIGFFPDVGTTFFLPRLDDYVGYYVALTGAILTGLDAYMLGFATHYIPSDRLATLTTRLGNLKPPVINGSQTDDIILKNQSEYFTQVNQVLEEFTNNKIPEDYKFPFTADELTTIKNAFSKSTIGEVFQALTNDGSPFALKTLDTLSKKPINSLKVALELLHVGSKNTIKKQFETELIAATNLMNVKPEDSDFVIGVKHKLIDKVKEPFYPQWTKPLPEEKIKKYLEESINTVKLESPLINSFYNLNFKQYPHHMGLPTVEQVKAFITGNDGSGRSYLPTPKEVINHFKQKTNNKLGVALKIESVLKVHGETSKYDDKYVSWKA
ncbi:uncharacterized protein KQ657_003028 [Scheffersomyces spartinae]|uniref:3-hydroxyisobutyryl-CoA hydrolase n=1 Tax=Scheffersomyces spartinae TaxID=45513 RepID=A0A9P7V5X5_9ASCO|nr:uncharacterized protein KQ657_003028 [Scheffersomyces spartinae]KAG7191524.1 hypothetical protein KQ657_003028 [Scheffersomyces spartinae]